MHTPRGLLILLAVTLLLTSLSAAPYLQSEPDGRYFQETGHWVEDQFLVFYNQTPDPLRLLGYPLTESFEHPMRTEVTIQYFQRARLEYNPNGPPGQQMRLAPLGDWLYNNVDHGKVAVFTVNSGACRLFATTGIAVCYAFLSFYDANRGPTYFGQPISEVEIIDGRLVQYFESARMEWRPEMPAGQRVGLTDIGRLDFDRTIGDPSISSPSANLPLVSPLSISVHAFPARPLLAAGENQTIFIVVQDQHLQPVAGATVRISLRLPDGSRQNLAPQGPTNSDGFTQVDFRLDNALPNQVVEVQVEASLANGPSSASVSWFRIWW